MTTYFKSQSSLKRVLNSYATDLTDREAEIVQVAILFEASPEFLLNALSSGEIEGGESQSSLKRVLNSYESIERVLEKMFQLVAILFEASPEFLPAGRLLEWATAGLVAILFEASPEFLPWSRINRQTSYIWGRNPL